MNSKYYEQSGNISLVAFLLIPLVAVIGGGLIGALIGVAQSKIMFIIIKIAAPIISGLLTGLVVGITGKALKVTNNKFLALFALIGAVTAIYTGWTAYIWGVTDFRLIPESPSKIFAMMKLFALTGVWSLKGLTPTGLFLYIIWGIEAFVTVLIAITLSVVFTALGVYCDRCRKWVEKEIKGSYAWIRFDSEMVKEVEKDSLKIFDYLKENEDPANGYTYLELYQCPTCRDCNYLSVLTEKKIKDVKGNETTQSNTIIDRLSVSQKNMKKIKEKVA